MALSLRVVSTHSGILGLRARVRADHLRLSVIVLPICTCIFLQLFLGVLWHPEARLYPVLLCHLPQHTCFLTFHVEDGLGVGLLLLGQLFQPLTLLSHAGSCDTHLSPVEPLNLLHNLRLFLLGFQKLASSILNS